MGSLSKTRGIVKPVRVAESGYAILITLTNGHRSETRVFPRRHLAEAVARENRRRPEVQDAVVVKRGEERCGDCGAALLTFEGEMYCSNCVRFGVAPHGVVWVGSARSGEARRNGEETAFKERRPHAARHGAARQGGAWRGQAGQGWARQG